MKTGLFMESEKGRQQYVLTKDLCDNVLKYGYCVYPRTFKYASHPEAGKVWEWEEKHMQKKNLKYSSVYFIRFLRRHNTKKINAIAQKCLMCGKCYALCPVSIDSPAIRVAQRATFNNPLPYNYSYLKDAYHNSTAESVGSNKSKADIMYFAGCMPDV